MEIIPKVQNLGLLSELELLRLHDSILDELRQRKVIRTNNKPLGDYAEWLVGKKLNFKLETSSRTGYDATDMNGKRYQIKARQLSSSNKSTQLSALRNLDQHEFDFLIGILFEPNYEIKLAVIIPWECISSYAKYTKHTNSFRLHLQNPLIADQNIIDITDALSTKK